MAFQITSDTVVKVLIRRGEEFDRKLTLLSNGEFGYSQDTNRVFIGDGLTLGGVPISNIFHGFVADRNDYTDVAQNGDMVFQTTNNRLYAFDDNFAQPWQSVHPQFNSDVFFLGGDTWFLNPNVFGSPFTYNPAGPNQSIAQGTNVVDFNSQFLSLCAASESFYFGDWADRPSTFNIADATMNVVDRLFVHNTESPNFYQLQMHARSIPDDGASMIKAARGTLYLKGAEELGFFSEGFKVGRIDGGNYFTIYSQSLGTYAKPNFDVQGYSRFREDVDFDKNITVTGNLSVLGDISYFDTDVVTTSALSVINMNENFTALAVAQLSQTPNQIVAKFTGNPNNTGNRPILVVGDGPFVGISTAIGVNAANTLANFVVSGGAAFGYVNPTDRFTVNAGSNGITLNTTGDHNSLTQGSRTLTINGTQSTLASRVELETTAGTIGNIPSLKITTGAANADTTKIGLEVQSSPGNYGLWVLPDAASGSFNGCTSSRDSVIVARGGVINDANAGIVLGVWSDSTRGMRIDNGGNVMVNTSTPSVDSATWKFRVANGTTHLGGNTRITGTLQVTNDITAFFSSDKNLKKNIKVIDSALEKVNQISGVEFEWDQEKQNNHEGLDIGVIAQEIEQVLPEIVTTRDDGYKAVRYEKIIPLLIQAIKELNTKIEQYGSATTTK